MYPRCNLDSNSPKSWILRAYPFLGSILKGSRERSLDSQFDRLAIQSFRDPSLLCVVAVARYGRFRGDDPRGFLFLFFGRTLFQDLSGRASLIRSDRLIIEKIIEVFADGLLGHGLFSELVKRK